MCAAGCPMVSACMFHRSQEKYSDLSCISKWTAHLCRDTSQLCLRIIFLYSDIMVGAEGLCHKSLQQPLLGCRNLVDTVNFECAGSFHCRKFCGAEWRLRECSIHHNWRAFGHLPHLILYQYCGWITICVFFWPVAGRAPGDHICSVHRHHHGHF